VKKLMVATDINAVDGLSNRNEYIYDNGNTLMEYIINEIRTQNELSIVLTYAIDASLE
jgi:hypothetical protein